MRPAPAPTPPPADLKRANSAVRPTVARVPPSATYRLQLRREFTFADAAAQIDYLADLGISHVYCSPITQAAHGSTHGYDVVDPTRISSALGGEAGFRALAATARAHGMGVLIDIVPNHMSTDDARNVWWWDVLEDGRRSPYADFFDIDWNHDHPLLTGKVLVPVLGERLRAALDAGDLAVVREHGLSLRYFEHLLPLSPESVADILDSVAGADIRTLVERIRAMPSPHTDAFAAREARREARIEIGAAMATAIRESGHAVDSRIAALNADPDALDALIRTQHYRVAHWRAATEEINYRRFFDVPTLVGVRMENPRAFDASHVLFARLFHEGLIDGVRVDHVDGLREPAAYLQRLRTLLGDDAWVLVEKIVAANEDVPPTWPVDGTTGYEFAARVTALLTDGSHADALTTLHDEITGTTVDADATVRAGRREAATRLLLADVERLAALATTCEQADDRAAAATNERFVDAVIAIVTEFPVYRTYVDDHGATSVDVGLVEAAVARAQRASPDVVSADCATVGELILGRCDYEDPVAAAAAREFRQRFPQVASAVAAKGVEDTAFYRRAVLLSQNEVGSQFDVLSITADEFHRFNQSRVATPRALSATSTHDTKRGEDVRARIAVLSEIPDLWRHTVMAWRDLLAGVRPGAIDAATDYFFLQTMVGTHPLDAERAVAYMRKATMEAKTTTSWLHPDAAYDDAVETYVRAALGHEAWLASVEEFCLQVTPWGRTAALSQTALKLTAPGVPDIYQGNEMWEDSLVDPDNRRAVDYAARRTAVHGIAEGAWPVVIADDADGACKLALTRAVLRYRRAAPDVFSGGYSALTAHGPDAESVVAFGRSDTLITVVTRFASRVADGWNAETVIDLPSGEWRDLVSATPHRGGVRQVGAIVDIAAPIAVLVRT